MKNKTNQLPRSAETIVENVYAKLVELLSEYASSDCFCVAPDNSDAFEYYYHKVEEIEEIIQLIGDNTELVNFLLSVTKAIKKIIAKCDLTGIPCYWFAINPNLKYYDPGFSIMMESPDLYEKIKNRELNITLDYYPNKLDKEMCENYFKNLLGEYTTIEYLSNKKKLLQKELINTIATIFCMYVPYYLDNN